MSSPTKADLAAAVTKLSEENAALRDLLGAARAYAGLPHPADYSAAVYAYECERRLDRIAVWANGDREDMDPCVYLLVMGDRAGHLREEAARPVRYEVRTAPEPEPAPAAAPASDDAARLCAKGGYMVGVYCKLPPHSEGDHLGAGPDGDVTWPQDPAPVASGTPVTAGDEPHCKCGHGRGRHADVDDSTAGRAPNECVVPGCGCNRWRLAAPEPPAEQDAADEAADWPTGMCGHKVTPGAWSQGYATCRGCLSDARTDGPEVALYDRATAGEQLPVAAKR